MATTAQIARKIGFRGNLNQLKQGIRVESEHRRTVGNNPTMYARIARDHLKEFRNYYTLLRRMEANAKRRR